MPKLPKLDQGGKDTKKRCPMSDALSDRVMRQIKSLKPSLFITGGGDSSTPCNLAQPAPFPCHGSMRLILSLNLVGFRLEPARQLAKEVRQVSRSSYLAGGVQRDHEHPISNRRRRISISLQFHGELPHFLGNGLALGFLIHASSPSFVMISAKCAF